MFSDLVNRNIKLDFDYLLLYILEILVKWIRRIA